MKVTLAIVAIILGGAPSPGIHVIIPGAFPRDHWMATITNLFKMWMFRYQLKLMPVEERGSRSSISFFSSVMYMLVCMPYCMVWNSLSWVGSIVFVNNRPKSRNPEIRQATSTDIYNCLGEVTVGLAFFDLNIEFEEKERSVNNSREQHWSEKQAPKLSYVNVGEHSILLYNTLQFFSYSTT